MKHIHICIYRHKITQCRKGHNSSLHFIQTHKPIHLQTMFLFWSYNELGFTWTQLKTHHLKILDTGFQHLTPMGENLKKVDCVHVSVILVHLTLYFCKNPTWSVLEGSECQQVTVMCESKPLCSSALFTPEALLWGLLLLYRVCIWGFVLVCVCVCEADLTHTHTATAWNVFWCLLYEKLVSDCSGETLSFSDSLSCCVTQKHTLGTHTHTQIIQQEFSSHPYTIFHFHSQPWICLAVLIFLGS